MAELVGFVTEKQPIVGSYDLAFAEFKWNISGNNYATVVVTVYSVNQFVTAHKFDANSSSTWQFGPITNNDNSTLSGTFTAGMPTPEQLGTLSINCTYTLSGQTPQVFSRTLVAWDNNGNVV